MKAGRHARTARRHRRAHRARRDQLDNPSSDRMTFFALVVAQARSPSSSQRASSEHLRSAACSAATKKSEATKKMLPGSKRGPKVKKWTKPAAFAFAEFFAKRSEPLPTAPSIDEAPLTEATGAGLKWLFSSFGN